MLGSIKLWTLWPYNWAINYCKPKDPIFLVKHVCFILSNLIFNIDVEFYCCYTIEIVGFAIYSLPSKKLGKRISFYWRRGSRKPR